MNWRLWLRAATPLPFCLTFGTSKDGWVERNAFVYIVGVLVPTFAKEVPLEYTKNSGFSLGYHKLAWITSDLLKSWVTATLANYSRREEVIQWVFRTSLSNVPIVGLHSLSLLGSKNSSRLKASLMSLGAVLLAARQRSQNVTEVVAMDTGPSKCSPQCATSVAKTPRYLLPPGSRSMYCSDC